MAQASLRLRDDLHFELRYEDRTPFGSAVSGQGDALVRKVCRPIFQGFRRLDSHDVRQRTTSLLSRCFDTHHLGALYQRPGRLHPACVHPAPELVLPAALRLFVAGEARGSVPVSPAVARDLARWCGDFASPGQAPRSAGARALWDALADADALWDAPLPVGCAAGGLRTLGKTSFELARAGTRLWLDPASAPRDADAPRASPPDAVFVSHGHEHQFAPGCLLGLHPDTPIYVPRVERESLLSVDMAARLRELGFRSVRTLGWGERVEVGPFRVLAQPLWGDQPTDGEVLHPELSNVGNGYWIDDGTLSMAWLSDAGRDRRGSSFDQASDTLARGQRADVVFANFRSEPLRTVEHLGIGLARHLLFVPPGLWTRPMHQVSTPDVLYATARRLGASLLVPLSRQAGEDFRLKLERLGDGPHIAKLASADRLSDADVARCASRDSYTRARHPLVARSATTD